MSSKDNRAVRINGVRVRTNYLSLLGDDGHVPDQSAWSEDQRCLEVWLLLPLPSPVLGQQAWRGSGLNIEVLKIATCFVVGKSARHNIIIIMLSLYLFTFETI